MGILKMVLNADFLLFVLGIYWFDIVGYIQNFVATCNPKYFGFVLAIIVYGIIKCMLSPRRHKREN